MGFSNIRIFSRSAVKDGEYNPTHVEIDGKEVGGVTSVDYHVANGELPTVNLELVSLENSGIDISNAELCIKFHPQTVHEAMIVLGIAGTYEEAGSPVFLFDDGK